MVWCGEAILALLFRVEGLWPSNRGQDARDTQGRDALATRGAIAKLRLTMPPMAQGTSQECYPGMRGIEPGHLPWGDLGGKCCTDKELRQLDAGAAPGRTKPISAGDRPVWTGAPLGLERLVASPRLRGDDIAANKASAPNKPNFRTGRKKDKFRADKELRRMGHG